MSQSAETTSVQLVETATPAEAGASSHDVEQPKAVEKPNTKSSESSSGSCCADPPPEIERNYTFGNGEAGVRTGDLSAAEFSGNAIYTNKYNWLTFVPVNLLEQFSREANFYFLIIAILCSISVISPMSPSTSLMPLVMVLGVTLIKDGLDDLKRRRADEQLNTSHTHVLTANGSWEQIEWKDLQVGHIVQLVKDDPIPADMLLLSAQAELDLASPRNISGIASIDTAQLDGETNLKEKEALPETAAMLTPELLLQFKGSMRCEPPNESLESFAGQLEMDGLNAKLHLKHKALLLRGCTLKNTICAYGLVIYSGPQTKIQMNLDRVPDPPEARNQCTTVAGAHQETVSCRSRDEYPGTLRRRTRRPTNETHGPVAGEVDVRPAAAALPRLSHRGWSMAQVQW